METKDIIEKWYRTLGFPPDFDAPFYRALGSVAVPEEAKLETYDLKSADGKKNLLNFLYFCERAHSAAAALGIPEEVTVDTLRDIVICTEDWTKAKGELCLRQLGWLKLHLQLRLFRLGRLQFCMGKAPRDIAEAGVRAGEPVLEIHVPRGGKLLTEACTESMEQARDFFARYFPEHTYKVFVCQSWLLDDGLKEYLPEDSNILRFGALFHRVYREPSNALLSSVFNVDTTLDNLADAPCSSAFAGRVKKAVLSGKSFSMVLGYLPK